MDQELIFRPGVRDELRHDAIQDLAKRDSKSELRVLVDAINLIDDKKENRDESVVFDLVRQLTGHNASELAAVRSDIEKLALSAKQAVIRQIGFVALINLDGNIDKAWARLEVGPGTGRPRLGDAVDRGRGSAGEHVPED